jgi:hypothetical protein
MQPPQGSLWQAQGRRSGRVHQRRVVAVDSAHPQAPTGVLAEAPDGLLAEVLGGGHHGQWTGGVMAVRGGHPQAPAREHMGQWTCGGGDLQRAMT